MNINAKEIVSVNEKVNVTNDQKTRYFDHDADIGIIGYGATVCDAFTDAAQSLFGIMADISLLSSTECIKFEFEESDIEYAFVIYLNNLIEQFRIQHIMFNQFHLENKDKKWYARSCGVHLTQQMERGVEVKGATLTMLSVKKLGGQWEARCVVDV